MSSIESQNTAYTPSRPLIFTVAGIALLISTVCPAVIIGLVGIISLLIYLHRVSKKWGDSRPFKIFVTGLALRFLMIAIYSITVGEQYTIFGDSEVLIRGSMVSLGVYLGVTDPIGTYIQRGFYGYSIIHWINGAFYLIAGYSPFLIRIIHIIEGSLAAWFVYLIAFRITNRRTLSAWIMGITLFWPSNILWSTDLLKEPIIQLYLAVIIYLFVDMIVRKRRRNLLILALIWYPIGEIRDQFHWIVLVTLLMSFVMFVPKRPAIGIAILIVLTLVGFVVIGPSGLKDRFRTLEIKVIGSQMGFVTTGGSYYTFIPDRFTPEGGHKAPMTLKEWLTSYVKAVFYYLGVPKPYELLTINKIPAMPQMILWYIMLILFFPVGVLYLIRYSYREAGVILVFLLVATSAAALFTGNEGTAFRHRDVLTPFYFIMITVGMFNLRGWLAENLRKIQSS